MSISYRFAKLNARMIENSQNFKHYISSKMYEYSSPKGLMIVRFLLEKEDNKKVKPQSLDNEGRYLGFHNAGDWTLGLTLGPILLGVTGRSWLLAFFLYVSTPNLLLPRNHYPFGLLYLLFAGIYSF